MALPFPIAHLVRRARNAKGPKERHDTAFFAWEASVRIAVAVAPPSDPAVLADPSTGVWVKCMKPSGEATEARALRQVAVLFATARVEDSQLPRTVSAKKILEHLAAYRNEVHGHGSTKTGDYYDPAADILLGAIEEAWSAGVFLEKGKKLVYVESVELKPGGERRARIVDLDGIAPLITSPREGARVGDDVAPRRLYVTSGTAYQPVHPWLLYEESELRERVLFFNGRRKSARYLDYVGGEVLKGQKLQTEFPTLEDELERTFGGEAESGKPVTSGDPPPSDPNRIGDYLLQGKLGEGGMGVVHLARQESLGRTVALKVLHPGAADDPVAVARFKREIAALARLDHENIVSILDSGEDRGRLYYAMELVEGVDLATLSRALSGDGQVGIDDAITTTFRDKPSGSATPRPPDVTLPSAGADEKKAAAYVRASAAAALPDRVRTLARLFRDAARAVHYLHAQGMIHRDLKPGNLMVTHADHRIVLMDLGLVAIGNASRSITKDTSSILGTLRYMPPEQLQRNAGDLDRRVDVYALGATFYELFTGRPLFDGDSEARLVQQVLHERPPAARAIAPKLPADLATILEKCLQKDRTMRYDGADELASDLEAFLDARPISARAPTLSYVAWMAARRNKPLAGLIALSVVLVFAGLPAYAIQQKNARVRADELTHEAEAQRNEARLAAARILEEQGRQELTLGRPAAAFHDLVLSLDGGNDGPVLRFLLARSARAALATTRELHAHDEAIASAAFAPDGKSFVTASTDHTIRVFDTQTGAETKKWDLGDRVQYAAFAQSGARIVAATKRRVAVYDVASGAAVLTLDEPWDLVAPSLSQDGTTLLLPTWNGEALVVDVATKLTVATLRPPSAAGAEGDKLPIVATFASAPPSGTRLLTASARTGIVIWDRTKEPAAARALPALGCDAGSDALSSNLEIRGEANAVFDDAGARVLAWSGCSHEARLFDAATGAELARLRASGVVTAGAFTADGKRVAVFGDDGRGALYRADDGHLAVQLHDGGAFLGMFRLGADGARIATAGDDERTRLWDTRSGALLAALDGHRAPVADLDVSRDGRLLLTAAEDGVVLLRTTECNWPHAALDHAPEGVLLSQDGTTILGWDALGAELVDAATGTKKPLGTRAPEATDGSAVLCGAFADDGTILTGGADGKARLFAKDGALETTLDHGGKVTAVAFAAGGKRFLTAGDEKTVRLWSQGKNEPTALLPHPGALAAATFFDGGRRVLTRTVEDVVSLWNGETGALVKTLPHKAARFGDPAVSASAARIALPCDDGVVRVFDGQGELAGTLRGTAAEDRRARLSPDGTRALTTSDGKTARVWDVAQGTVLFVLEGDRSRMADGVYSPDGAFLLTSHDDGAARI